MICYEPFSQMLIWLLGNLANEVCHNSSHKINMLKVKVAQLIFMIIIIPPAFMPTGI